MADQEQQSDDRNEDPTPRRRQKAREEGKIARSAEFGSAGMLLVGGLILGSFAGRSLGAGAMDLFRTGPSWLLMEEPSVLGVVALVRMVVLRYGVAMAPLFLGLAIAAVVFGLLQTKGLVTTKPLAPDFNRINPLNGIKRVFGTESIVNLVKSLLKLVVLGFITWAVIDAAWPGFVTLIDAGPPDVVKAVASTTMRLSLTLAVAFMAIGVLDYAVQFHRLEKSLKMSRYEIVQEHREQEGDPHIKARIRQIGRQRARQRMLSQVAHADVVITNPTHIAVALKYDVTLSGAPVVVAMGERKLAERIKKIAAGAGVPMIENKPLARTMLATAVVGAPIPPALYVAVAEILAYVYKMKQRGLGNTATRRPLAVAR